MNNFSNDGSFLERYRHLQQQKEDKSIREEQTQKRVEQEKELMISQNTISSPTTSSTVCSTSVNSRSDIQKRREFVGPTILSSSISTQLNKNKIRSTISNVKNQNVFKEHLDQLNSDSLKCATTVLPESSNSQISQMECSSFLNSTVSTHQKRVRKRRWDANDDCPSSVTVSNVPQPGLVCISSIGGSVSRAPVILSNTSNDIPSTSKLSSNHTDYSADIDMSEVELQQLRDTMRARAIALSAIERIAPSVNNEFDIDEVTGDPTWEHRKRQEEMDRTCDIATQLTVEAGGKHHISDFLPEHQTNKFLQKLYGKDIDKSDFQDNKLTTENKGFQMLQKLGWKGGGLGPNEQGIQAPVNKGRSVTELQGLGADRIDQLTDSDDAYSSYRKRMMMAYKYRPNPLNNPRRKYY